jgi:hypothetical protein
MKAFRISLGLQLRGLVALAILAAVLGWSAGAAIASFDNSATKAFSVAGVPYENHSYLENTPENAHTNITRVDGFNAPTGWIGAKARIYWAGGTLCSATVWGYNTSSTVAYIKYLNNGDCGGYMYSQGRTAAWNGTDYVRQDTYKTTNLYG